MPLCVQQQLSITAAPRIETAGPTSGVAAAWLAFEPVKTRFLSVTVASGSVA